MAFGENESRHLIRGLLDDRLGSGKEEERMAGGGSGSSATASRRARAAGAVVLRAAFPDCPMGSRAGEGPRGPTPFSKMG